MPLPPSSSPTYRPPVYAAWFALAAWAVAFHPLLAWYGRRLVDGSDEPWGFLPLIVILSMTFTALVRRMGSLPDKFDLLLLAAVALFAAATARHLPPLARAVPAFTVLAVLTGRVLRNQRFDLALWGLLMLSLPVIASLQFYAGYPLRTVIAEGAVFLLRFTGIHAAAAGATIQWGDAFVSVDAPCSGVKSLWTGGVFVLALCLALRLGNRRTALAGGLAFLLILAGNIVRAAALFFLETGIWPGRPWHHAAIGLTAFAGTLAAIAFLTCRIACRHPYAAAAPADSATAGQRCEIRRRYLVGTAAVCLVAAALPFVLAAPPPPAPLPNTPANWPATFEGHPLTPATEPAAEYGKSVFPGRIGVFSDGTRTIVFRQVTRPTRLLHPIADCFRGSGYRVTPGPLFRDDAGRQWNRFTACRASRTVEVRECITDAAGQSWSDLSGWYWSAVLDKSTPPWTAIVVVAKETP